MKPILAALWLVMGLPAAADPLAACLPGLPGIAVRAQEQNGHVACAAGTVTAKAGARRGGRVGKAALILPFGARVTPGETLVVSAEILVPEGAPRDSVHLMDLECKHCGLPGNPGLRLYLRDGRLRIDRAKIGLRHAWVDAAAPRLAAGAWVRVEWELGVSDGADGHARVRLDGVEVLSKRGRTVPVGPDAAGIDRLQIGVTANSNDGPATVRLRDIRLSRSVGADG